MVEDGPADRIDEAQDLAGINAADDRQLDGLLAVGHEFGDPVAGSGVVHWHAGVAVTPDFKAVIESLVAGFVVMRGPQAECLERGAAQRGLGEAVLNDRMVIDGVVEGSDNGLPRRLLRRAQPGQGSTRGSPQGCGTETASTTPSDCGGQSAPATRSP